MRKLLLFAAVAGLSIGCSRNLDKKTAAEEIKMALERSENSIHVHIGRGGSKCEVQDDQGRSRTGGLRPEDDREVIIAQSLGYITATPDGKDYWKISLTEKGQSVMSAEGNHLYAHQTGEGCDYQQGDFVIATPELIEVTEIKGGPKAAVAYFTYKWKATELGAALRKGGEADKKLTPLQRETLYHGLLQFSSTVAVKIPVPREDNIESSSLIFAKGDDGWQQVYTPRF